MLGAKTRYLFADTSRIVHVVLNRDICEVDCRDCGVETMTSEHEHLPDLVAMDIRNNRTKDISFKTNYEVPVFVAGNDGIKFKYLCFMLSEDFGFPPGFYDPEIRRERWTDYYDMVTNEEPVDLNGYYMQGVTERGETYLDIDAIIKRADEGMEGKVVKRHGVCVFLTDKDA